MTQLAHPFRVQGPETPILALGKKCVRGRAGIGALGEKIAVAPGVISSRVHPEGQVEIKFHAAIPAGIEQVIELLVSQPLHVGEVIRCGRGKVMVPKHPIPRPALPRRPGGAQLFHRRAEARVFLDLGAAFEEPLEFPAACRIGIREEFLRERFEDAAAQAHSLPVIDQFAGAQSLERFLESSGRGQSTGAR